MHLLSLYSYSRWATHSEQLSHRVFAARSTVPSGHANLSRAPFGVKASMRPNDVEASCRCSMAISVLEWTQMGFPTFNAANIHCTGTTCPYHASNMYSIGPMPQQKDLDNILACQHRRYRTFKTHWFNAKLVRREGERRLLGCCPQLRT